MIDDRDDIRRPAGTDPYFNQRPRMPSASYSWGIPVGIAALFLLAGFLFFNSGGHGPDRTATNNAPAMTQTNPSSPTRPAPAPNPTQ
jgi:hypothetical protein